MPTFTIIRLQPNGACSSFGRPDAPGLSVADATYCKAAGKRRFSTREEAEDELDRLNGRAGRTPIRSYPCSKCAGYHVTSRPREES